MQVWIGEKQCYYGPGVGTYEEPTGAADEIDVAGAWRTWSLLSAIFMGLVLFVNLMNALAGVC